MGQTVLTVMTGVYLSGAACRDLLNRTVSKAWAFVFMTAAILYHILQRDMTIAAWGAGMIPALVMLAAALLTKQAFGCGDCLVLAVLGGMRGAGYAVLLLLAGLCLAAVFSCVGVVMGKLTREGELPFVPFLLTAFLLQTLTEWL